LRDVLCASLWGMLCFAGLQVAFFFVPSWMQSLFCDGSLLRWLFHHYVDLCGSCTLVLWSHTASIHPQELLSLVSLLKYSAVFAIGLITNSSVWALGLSMLCFSGLQVAFFFVLSWMQSLFCDGSLLRWLCFITLWISVALVPSSHTASIHPQEL